MRYDVMWPKEVTDFGTGEVKTVWVKLGAAFGERDGSLLTVKLDTLPIGAWEGRMVLFPKDS